jgi:excisionase family DNA binding protein
MKSLATQQTASEQIADLEYLTVKKTAQVLRCTTRTVRQKISDGYLRGYRNGKRILIAKKDLREYIGCRAIR